MTEQIQVDAVAPTAEVMITSPLTSVEGKTKQPSRRTVAKSNSGAEKSAQKERQPMKTARKAGPAMVAIKLKANPVKGVCIKLGCTGAAEGYKWCKACKKAIRKAQLKANNVIWRKRVKEGTAEHHVVYAARATSWALKTPEKAVKQVKEGRSVIPTVKQFKQILSKTKHEPKRLSA